MPNLRRLRGVFDNFRERLFGWRTNRRILIIESDDWGSVYLPTGNMLQTLLTATGFRLGRAGYRRFDCLENRQDLEELFDVLTCHRDRTGRPCQFTCNMVMGNPDFQKIRDEKFQLYHFQPFHDSYLRYHEDDLKDVWESGFQEKLVRPQFHAREHLNVPLWMNELRAGIGDARKFLECHFFAQSRSVSPPKTYLSAYWALDPSALNEIKRVTKEGLQMFENVFGFRSQSFVACKFILPDEINEVTAAAGVHTIQTQRRHRVPRPDLRRSDFRTRISGSKNRCGQVYSVRNVSFEPFENPTGDTVAAALAQTANAFQNGKPAIVSSHRGNYVGSVDQGNRENTLRQLTRFLQEILRRWPDIEFRTTDELRGLMESPV